MFTRTITVQTKFEGIHCWPEAPKEVYFLAFPHRHMFTVAVTMSVKHNDRDLEFIMVKHSLDRFIKSQMRNSVIDRMLFESQTSSSTDKIVWEMGSMSCEQLAEYVITFLRGKYDQDNNMTISCTVFEDEENGATVTYIPE